MEEDFGGENPRVWHETVEECTHEESTKKNINMQRQWGSESEIYGQRRLPSSKRSPTSHGYAESGII